MLILYAISIFAAFGVVAWAMCLIYEYDGLCFEPISSVAVAGAGFAVFPFINIFTTFVLVIMCLDAEAKHGKEKRK